MLVQKRRYLAVAAALAVTSPLALAAASPAFADPAPVVAESGSGRQDLQDAVTEARAVYAEAVRARIEAYDKVEALLEYDKDNPPALVVAAEKTRKAAEEAKAAFDAAASRVDDAEAALAEADEAGKAAAEQELADAELALADARQHHLEAAEAAEEADTELDDAEVAVLRDYESAKLAEKSAEEALKKAEEALANAKDCKKDTSLKAKALGLPEQLVAGEQATFTVRMTNGSEHTLDIRPLTFVVIDSGGDQDDLKAEWKDGDGWKALETAESPDVVFEGVEPGERVDVRMRLTLDKDAEEGHAVAAFAVDPAEGSLPCLYGPMKTYDLKVLPAGSTPSPSPSGSGDPSASPSPSPSGSGTPGATPQGG
ncbi:hypothetical protein, partial [Streptomyces sp. UH6]|uniref:hypothetical protein n=1 Tax=Streptomyces sp. UH6 TaxID=2748379 RepID=UPI0015D4D5E3